MRFFNGYISSHLTEFTLLFIKGVNMFLFLKTFLYNNVHHAASQAHTHTHPNVIEQCSLICETQEKKKRFYANDE